ncbi:ABC transporter permease [Pseudoscardovia suis]|uniref:ABC transporter permease n=1 Tax=Pseudoscardovia suis TaxID=987063 RepID=A0A261EYD6_9BIFI|nr:FtsX-like permease family protein [Pseudoscardovia suis]OZG51871.1 ABC transporter permease [Pseudoscardovia suis]PJJ69530.1 putative ABC transport system permease protein [Pseudoscardovia suis]
MTGDSNNNSNAANRRMFFTMLWGAMFRRRSRAVMAVLASLVGAATLFCLTVVCLEVPRQMSEEFRSYGANLVVSSTAVSSTASSTLSAGASEGAASSSTVSDAQGMDSATLNEVIAAVDAAGQENHAEYRYENVRVHAASYIIAGMNPADTRVLDQHWTVEGDWPASGDTKNIMVGRDIADAMNLQVGSSLTMSYRGDSDDDSDSASQASDSASASASASSSAASHASSDIMDTSGESFRVCGIIDTGGEEDSMIYADMALVEQLSGTERGADAVEFASSLDADGLDALVSSINAHSAQWHVTAQKVSRISAANQRIITMLNTLFWIVSLVVLVLTLIGVATTVTSIVSQRRNEIGLRKALGASAQSIAREFYAQSALYGLAGSVLGIAVGYAVATVLATQVFGKSVGFHWVLALASAAVTVAVTVVASVGPVHRASRIDPAVVLREE